MIPTMIGIGLTFMGTLFVGKGEINEAFMNVALRARGGSWTARQWEKTMRNRDAMKEPIKRFKCLVYGFLLIWIGAFFLIGGVASSLN